MPQGSILGDTVLEPESVVFDPGRVTYSSGGCSSHVHHIPDYQKSAVNLLFRAHEPSYPYYENLVPNADDYTLPNITTLAGDTGDV